MTKAEIVELIHEKYGMTKKDVIFVVNQVFSEIREELLASNSVKITGFGNFEIKTRGRRIGRNPKTGEETVIPPRTVVKFRPSRQFKDEVNES